MNRPILTLRPSSLSYQAVQVVRKTREKLGTLALPGPELMLWVSSNKEDVLRALFSDSINVDGGGMAGAFI